LVPQGDLSWESHLFGFIVGVLAARALAEPRRRPGTEDDTRYDWELDEPWRD
jgi:membrane associated rhomboid family serine protease